MVRARAALHLRAIWIDSDGTMQRRFTLQHRGKRYTIERGRSGPAAARGGGAPVDPERWYITLAGTALAAVEAKDGEDERELRARIRAWLDAHPELQDRDQIHLAGG
jgi:hypothetical protein